MRILHFIPILICLFLLPVQAMEYTAPPVPDSAQNWMPQSRQFGEGLGQILTKALKAVNPDICSGIQVASCVLAATVMVGCIGSFSGITADAGELVGVVVISSVLVSGVNSMIHLGGDTIREMTSYGKLLLPVMTAALAAQGGITSSAALYAGTAAVNALIGNCISKVLLPMVYCYLALSVATAAVGEGILKNMRDLLKTIVSWSLKTVLTVFTAYMSISGVVSGTTDAAALKATKVAISSVVPVVGGILSDASEAVLVSAALARNAAGIYGVFAILAIFLVPFFRMGIHYMILKITGSVCGIFAPKRLSELIMDVGTSMGLMLAMTGAVCLIQLISTVCFMKGVT